MSKAVLMSEVDQLFCPQCGKPILADAPRGLCPNCVMVVNLGSETAMHPSVETDLREPPLRPEEIAGRFPDFEILECLGRGGMGVVYRARQKALEREVAIKILAGEWQEDRAFEERFEHEAKTLAQMSHPNIVTVHDFGEADGLYFIVMEFVDGVNLRDLLNDAKMTPSQALSIVPSICDALEYAHGKGIVHRDIKPENLLLDRDGRIRIADFGVASLVGDTSDIAGTPSYMAPEQASGKVDSRTDIYALGVVLYEMLTGERPTKNVVAPSRKVVVDVTIDEMVLRALETEPERRYQTAGEFRTTAELAISTGSTAPKAGNGFKYHKAWSMTLAGLGTAAVVAVLAIGDFLPRTTKATGFGPVQERLIALNSSDTSYYSFERGYVSSPTEFDPSDQRNKNRLWKWLTENQVDVFTRTRDGRPVIVRSEMLTMDLEEQAFDQLSLEKLRNDPGWQSLLRRQFRSQESSTLSRGELSGNKDTFAFQTRFEKTGLLQVVGVSSEPAGIRVRYKMAQETSH